MLDKLDDLFYFILYDLSKSYYEIQTKKTGIINELFVLLQNRCQQYQSSIVRLNTEITTLRQQLEQAGRENNPEGILQAHAAALQRQAEESRKQYERCLDDVANQVVRALLTQKVG